LHGAALTVPTTLTRVEPHRLRALILEDLSRYPGASSTEVNRRIGVEISTKTIKRMLDDLADDGQIRHEGERRWRRYWLAGTRHP
jgi:ATP-dependent DNA helicase RecG